MKYLGAVLFIGFISLAVFSVFGMHNGMQNHGSDCIASMARGSDCPRENNTANYLAFHLDAFKSFSLAILEINFSILVLLILFIVFRISFRLPSDNSIHSKLNILHTRYRRGERFKSPAKHALTHWLSLHENSPTFA